MHSLLCQLEPIYALRKQSWIFIVLFHIIQHNVSTQYMLYNEWQTSFRNSIFTKYNLQANLCLFWGKVVNKFLIATIFLSMTVVLKKASNLYT